MRFDWPGAAQRETNEIALEFSASIVPAEQEGSSGDTRDLAAALFSLSMADARDKTIDLLLERDTPRAYALIEKDGAPAFTLPGRSQTSFAFRLPTDASLEFECSLDPWSAASGGKGSLLVAFESTDGTSRESVQIPLGSPKAPANRIAISGEMGTPLMVRMDVVSENPGVTFAHIRAPRIMSRAPVPAAAPAPRKLS